MTTVKMLIALALSDRCQSVDCSVTLSDHYQNVDRSVTLEDCADLINTTERE